MVGRNRRTKRVDVVKKVVEQKNMYAKRQKLGKQSENQKMPYPQYIRTYNQTTMMPNIPQSMGFYYC